MNTEHVHSADEVQARLQRELPGWTYTDGYLQRLFKTADWNSALALVNRIGELAEAAWHHPDIELGYGRVRVRLITHSAGGITDKDFSLALAIERQDLA